eukprot:5853930-Heterocapsa_arctica.AAC.1
MDEDGSAPRSLTPTHAPTEAMADDDDDEKPPVDDNEVAPDLTDPASLSFPPWMGASIDTNDHLRQFYMPAEPGLGHFTTMKNGGVRVDSLTTRELMEYR